MEKYVIDTNVICRYLLNDDKELYKKASNFFELLRTGKAKAYLEQTVLTETVFALSKVYKVSREDISQTLSNLLLIKGILLEDRDILIKALELYADTTLHIVDCVIAARCILWSVAPMTFDEGLKKLITKHSSTEETLL